MSQANPLRHSPTLPQIRRELLLKDLDWLAKLDNYRRDMVPILKHLQDIREQFILTENEESSAPEDLNVAHMSW